MLTPDVASATLRAAGMRLTPQRRAVIDVLSGDRTHPTADEVAARVSTALPGVSLSTVYKTLHEFAEAGLVLELDTPGSMRFDAETIPHAHFVCAACGTVSDVMLTAALSHELAAAVGVSRVDVTLGGTCTDCSA